VGVGVLVGVPVGVTDCVDVTLGVGVGLTPIQLVPDDVFVGV
jgi:hypothetical protein